MKEVRLPAPPGLGESASGGARPEDLGAIPKAVEEDGEPSVPVAAGFGEDILLVDDNQANLVAIEAALAPLGRKIVATRSGVEALAALLRQDFALILLDVEMPGMDGLETARLIRARDRHRATPIIFITGIEWPTGTDLRGYELGAFDFLMKPLRAEVLCAKASVFIQLHERTAALQRKSEELRAEQQRVHEYELYRSTAQQLELLADSLPLLAWYADPDGTIRWRNRRWYEYTGVPVGQLEAARPTEKLDPLERAAVLSKWHECVRTGEPWEDTFRLRRHDGQSRWFLSRAVPLRDRSGKIVRWFGTNVDIDEHKALEAAAKAASRAKDEFLAMLGHELRNPLAPIQTALDLMRIRDPGAAEEERAVIERQVRHLTRLVDDLLDVSRITQRKVELRREPVELSEVVARAVELTSPLLEKKSHRLKIELTDRRIVLDGDPTRLAQVLANVLGNAAKYTDPGGDLSIVAEVMGDGDGAAPRVRVRIRDNGIGISEEMRPRIFEFFTQERQGADRGQGGLGLGLAIARSLVEMHGGTIAAHSEGLGRGSEVVLELPIVALPGAAAAAPPMASSSPELRLRLRVLVVDDNEDAAELLAEALAKSGHEVRHAFDGPSALALVDSFSPDVAVLDLGLPVMDGYELVGQLRARRRAGGGRYIAVTGYGQAEDRKRTKEAGFHLHLVKPISLRQVREALIQVMALPDPSDG